MSLLRCFSLALNAPEPDGIHNNLLKPWGYTENPKRDPKQDMDLNGLSSSMESSNSDLNPQTK